MSSSASSCCFRVTAARSTETLAVIAAQYCSAFSENDSCDVKRCSNAGFSLERPLLLPLLLFVGFAAVAAEEEEEEVVISTDDPMEEDE